MTQCWSIEKMADLTGKQVVITGANAGLGFYSANILASRGAEVTLACRSEQRGQQAIKRILASYPEPKLHCLALDLADIRSVQRFAEGYLVGHRQLDILLNNAGVVNLAELARNEQGWEMHMATNHLGHFALTGLLMPALLAAEQARVVTLSSGGYKVGTIDFEDFHWQRRPYHRIRSYGDSKLANLLFCTELADYFERQGSKALSLAAHPGLTATERQQSIGVGGWLSRVLAAPMSTGVLPQLRAATDPSVKSRDYFGPRFGIRGSAAQQKMDLKKVNKPLARELWQFSEQLTGVSYPGC